jgi:hypothetical protein
MFVAIRAGLIFVSENAFFDDDVFALTYRAIHLSFGAAVDGIVRR